MTSNASASLGGGEDSESSHRREHRIELRKHSIIHGRIGLGSNDLATLLMMEFYLPGEGVGHVRLSTEYTSTSSSEPDPEVIGISPGEDLYTDRSSEELDLTPTHTETNTGYIRGFIPSANDTARWEAYGDAVLEKLILSVLIRRQNNERFHANCYLEKLGKTHRPGPILIDPAAPAPRWSSIADENLLEFLKELKTTGQNYAAAVMDMDEEARHCLVSLSAPRQQSSYPFIFYQGLIFESIRPEMDSIIRWLDKPDQPRVCWLHGPPGSGKTTLAVSVVRILQAQGNKILAHYFRISDDRGLKRTSVVLKSLIHQIILRKPKLLEYVLRAYQATKDKLFGDTTLLWSIIQQIIQDSGVGPIVFIIDGLDECDEELLDKIRNLNTTLSAPDKAKSQDKWILISREQQIIDDALSGSFELDLNTAAQSDIEVYAGLCVDSLDLDQDSKRSLREYLVQKANGSFLWIRRTGDALRSIQATSLDISEIIASAPSSLSSIYDQYLDRLVANSYTEKQRLARFVLSLAPFTFRPLSLSTVRLLSKDTYDLDVTNEKLKSTINEICHPFVTIYRDNVLLTHKIARDCLLSPVNVRKLGHESISDIHKNISIRCLEYICDSLADYCEFRSSTSHAGNLNLLEYPTLYWMRHGGMSSQTVEEVHTLFTSNDFFDEHSKIRSTWFTKYWLFKNGVAETRPVNFTMMHMAAESGYVQLVHVLVNSKYRPDVNARDGLERTPLHWAVANRYYEVARLLLENGANPNATSADQSSVLHVAIQVRQIDLVRLLLDHGVYFETEWLRGTRAEMQQLLQGYVRLKYKLPENAAVEKKFWGRVIDIGSSQRCHSKAVPVDEILDPGNSLNELMLDDRPEDLFKNERNSVRWIHLPENNMEWVEILLTKVLGTPEATANLLRSDLWRDRVRNAEKNYYKRCLRPVSTDFCNTSTNPMNPTSPGKSRIMLAIPYLHWATDTERLMLKNTIHAIRNGDNSLSKSERVIHADGNKHRELLDTYFNRDSPLHVRRTLDQFYYFNLDEEEMDIRDKDQTISKYYNTANNVNPGEVPTNTQKIHDYPVLMVDQLWLWVIDGDTVITSFPHRWANDASGIDSFNMTDVVAAIERRILSKAWPNAIKSGTDLAALIANECSGILFDPARHRDKWIQTQEIYENTIGNLANRESSIFQAFSRSINRPKDWGTEKGENERYAIKEEIDLLKDIKDIRDELNMIRTIFEAQISAVDGFVIFHHLQYLVTNRIKDVDRIDQRASRAQDALSHILDLKQKQANAEEAHFLSVQNIESGKQSRAIMTFTIVTIIWAPLSFFSSFFAIQFTDFPKLTMGFVLKYLVPISLAIVFLCCIIAFFNIFKDWFTNFRVSRNRAQDLNDKEKGE